MIAKSLALSLIALCLHCYLPPAQAADVDPHKSLTVNSDFPGGSGEGIEIDDAAHRIRLVPSTRKDRGWVNWWYVRVSGIRPNQTLTIEVGDTSWATPDRASLSVDNKTWQQTSPGKRVGKSIIYSIKVDAGEAWLAWGPPFVPSDAEALCKAAARESKHARAFELCRTREDCAVPALHIRQPGAADAERVGIWINARQHAWESGSSWVCRGLVEWLVSNDARAEALRKRADITIVPIMDIDNTAIGAGGKEQKPQDHNRDWSDQPYHRSVAAAQQSIRQMNAQGRFQMYVDLHNPGPGDREPYFYVSPKTMLSEVGWKNLNRFLDAARSEIRGPLKYRGATRESGLAYDKNWQKISKNWVTKHTAEHVVSVTLETPWNTPHSTTEGYQQVGKELGLAIERYFRAKTPE